VRASVGTVEGLLASDDLPEWLRNASMALGEAKRRGRNQSVAFSPALAEHAFERARLSNELRQALEKDEFLVHYQPVVDLASGRMVGAEALLRWHSPTRGMVPPGLFIPTAEESDLILARCRRGSTCTSTSRRASSSNRTSPPRCARCCRPAACRRTSSRWS
jgi:predicted signal transduction protein with EAL and GGDEF domain